ncbi:transporter substrate-binding domain-containing protein [Zooshikella marina]|uniref:substrate-binding periplasmic protein n=1 Tax=Zooshikella ganghwensis TaxID=202772 RepID=UPI001BAFE2DF|nr:transporter substrate-binding domain-containing protein [Zooshikella ganghwensis]MBU2707484.1 transporter substrate-binding domain-containing protein [Zooshikella ganghwensis]
MASVEIEARVKSERRLRYISLVVLYFTICIPIKGATDTIALATGSWCPYICPDVSSDTGLSDQPGFFVEIVREILSEHGYHIKLTVVPWSRAILGVRNGDYDGVLGTVPLGLPDLIFPEKAQSYYHMCFFTRLESSWEYAGVRSLANLRLGVIQDYNYDNGGELDQYILQETNGFWVSSISGEDIQALSRNIDRLIKKRVDVIIDGREVVNYYLKNKAYNLREAGCVSRDEMYVAFSPMNDRAKEYAEILSNGMVRLRASGKLEKILAKYGVKDWQ